MRIDANEDQVTRRQLTKAEMAEQRLAINVQNGRYFWASRGNPPLTFSSSGEFTYLSSSEPGKYVRFRRVNDRIVPMADIRLIEELAVKCVGAEERDTHA